MKYKKFFNKYKVEIIIFLFVVVLRLFVFQFLFGIEGNLKYQFPLIEVDSREYYQIALNLTENGHFSQSISEPYVPDDFRTPVYPALIALILLFFKSVYFIPIVQAIMSGFIGVLTYKIGKRFFSEKVGLIASVLFALEPSGLFFSSMVMTETLFLLLLLQALWLLLNNRHFLLIGILLGLATLTRPIGIFLPFLFVALHLLFNTSLSFRKKIMNSLILFAIFFLILAPWSLRNKKHFDSYEISSVSSYNIYYYNAQRFYMYQNNLSFTEAREVFNERIVSEYGEGATLPSLKYSSELREEGLSIIKDDVVGYTKFHLSTLGPFFLTDGLREITQILKLAPKEFLGLRGLFLSGDFGGIWNSLKNGGSLSVMFIAGFILWSFMSLFMILSLFFKKSRREVWMVFISIMFLALLSGVVTTARFRYAISPLIFILALHGLSNILFLLRARRLLVEQNI
jgi:4-amino-4-deoxy-L-arabinose transferase-like glycosyltransferase